jgi:hypothetical protein
MNKFVFLISGCILLTATFFSCVEEATGGMKAKPGALGRLNEIVVIASQNLWESSVKDSFDFYFESAYPIMPAPEPMFDIRHFTPTEIYNEPLRQELRTYVLLVDLSEKETKTIEMIRTDLGEERYNQALAGEVNSMVVRDKWARGQMIIYLLGKNKDDLISTIRKNYPAVSRRINIHDKEQLQANIYTRGINLGLTERIEETYGIKINIPATYKVAQELPDENFIWLRKDDESSTMNIMITKVPYENQSQFSVQNMKELRDKLGLFVTSPEPGSVMVINDKDLPVYDYSYEIDGNYTREIRGIWEMTKDYFGGPFASYLIMDKSNNNLLFIDTFVYAPGKSKRNMMQQLDLLVKTADLSEQNISSQG